MFHKATDWLIRQIQDLPRMGQAPIPVNPYPTSARNQARLARKKRKH